MVWFRRAHHCRVLPAGEYNGIILEPLAVYPESLRWQLYHYNEQTNTGDQKQHFAGYCQDEVK